MFNKLTCKLIFWCEARLDALGASTLSAADFKLLPKSSCDNCLERRQFRPQTLVLSRLDFSIYVYFIILSLNQFFPQNILFAYQAKKSSPELYIHSYYQMTFKTKKNPFRESSKQKPIKQKTKLQRILCKRKSQEYFN